MKFRVGYLPEFPVVEATENAECAIIADKNGGSWTLTRLFHEKTDDPWQEQRMELSPAIGGIQLVKAMSTWCYVAHRKYITGDVLDGRPNSTLVTPDTRAALIANLS